MDAVTVKASEIAAVKDDAEKDLAAAKPALDSALAALNSITQKDIVGLKALKNPPDVVKRIFDCVLLLRWGLPAGRRMPCHSGMDLLVLTSLQIRATPGLAAHLLRPIC